MLHVDRSGSLRVGDELKLERALVVDGEPGLTAHISSRFPDGLSRHGLRYLYEGSPDPAWTLNHGRRVTRPGEPETVVVTVEEAAEHAMEATNHQIEIVFELVRREVAPHAPSRFASIFAVDSARDARRFHEAFPGPATPFLCTLRGEPGPRFDMQWLTGGSGLKLWHQAANYWTSVPTDDPLWEYVLPAPQQVTERRAL